MKENLQQKVVACNQTQSMGLSSENISFFYYILLIISLGYSCFVLSC